MNDRYICNCEKLQNKITADCSIAVNPSNKWNANTHRHYYAALGCILALNCTITRASTIGLEYAMQKTKPIGLKDALDTNEGDVREGDLKDGGLTDAIMKTALKCGGFEQIKTEEGSVECFWGFTRKDENSKCFLDLQIHNSGKLYICCESSVGDGKVGSDRCDEMFEKVEKTCSDPEFSEIQIKPCQGEARGNSSKIAEVFFGEKNGGEDTTYMAMKKVDHVHLPTTADRVEMAARLVAESCR